MADHEEDYGSFQTVLISIICCVFDILRTSHESEMAILGIATIGSHFLHARLLAVSVIYTVHFIDMTFFQEFTSELKDLDRIKPEFIPFFLNYLRDQSSSLLQGCRSRNQSPAKTPASIKAKIAGAPSKGWFIKLY